jgi:hypothetical protein
MIGYLRKRHVTCEEGQKLRARGTADESDNNRVQYTISRWNRKFGQLGPGYLQNRRNHFFTLPVDDTMEGAIRREAA